MIGTALRVLFPSARPDVDYLVRDDGDGRGPYIDRWALAAPPPSQAEIDAAITAAASEAAIKAEIDAIEAETGISRRLREWLLANLTDPGLKAKLAEVDATIAGKRARLG